MPDDPRHKSGNGWWKYVPWAVAFALFSVVFATGAAHQRITNNAVQIEKNEDANQSVQDALKEQAETNGRIEERTRLILDRITDLNSFVQEMRRER